MFGWFIKASLVTALVAILVSGAPSTSTRNNDVSEQNMLQSFDYKPRIFILSDILNEPDDSMSLIRYLLYSNEFDTRGICATTSWWLPSGTHPEEMERIIRAYGEVVDNLNSHVHANNSYQDAEDLLALVTSGPTVRVLSWLSRKLYSPSDLLLICHRPTDEPH